MKFYQAITRRLFELKEDLFVKMNVVPPFPNYICLEVTNACNLRCVQCLYQGGTTSHYERKTGFIDTDFAKNILDQLREYDAGVMLNGDGEALLHPEFHKIARYACEQGLSNVFFNTNGTLFSKEFTDAFVQYFKGSVCFSLDGFKESHERLRVGSSYEKVVSNLEYLLQRVREEHSPIKVQVAYCNYDQPPGEREAFIKYWCGRVDGVSIGEVFNKEYQIISNQLNRQEHAQRIRCKVPWATCIVGWDGLVFPCSNCFPIVGEKGYVLGDAKKQKLVEIWHGEQTTALRKITKDWNIAGTLCEKCDRWNMFVSFGSHEEQGLDVTRSGVFTVYKKTDEQ